MSTPTAPTFLALALLAACSPQRPVWADGAMVRTVRPADAPPQELGNFAGRLLAIHNQERARVGVPPLTWDPALAASAAAYGPQLAAFGRLQHSAPQIRPGQGENLWMGTAGAFSLEEMARSWAEERSYFRAGAFPNVSRSGNWSDVGHYTQMIWRGTTRVGCALHRGGSADYLICRYTPVGNVVGQTVP